MAKKVIGLSLDEETIAALDEASEILGMNRSMVVRWLIDTTVGNMSATEMVKVMLKSAAAKGAEVGEQNGSVQSA